MKRLENETFEDYKLRRKHQNKIDRIRLRGCFIWRPDLQGQRHGKFKPEESLIFNDMFNNEAIEELLKSKEDKQQDATDMPTL